MLNRTNPFEDDDNDTVIDSSRKGCRGITPASCRKQLIKNKMLNRTNPFDDADNDTAIDGSREGRRGITPASRRTQLSKDKMLNRTNPFDDDDNDTAIDGSWKGCRGITPASRQKQLIKNKMLNRANPFDDDDDEIVIDGSREGRRGITPSSFPASLSSWTTANASPPLHSPPGEVDDGVTWYHDCDTFFTTYTPKCWRNIIESIHRCSGSISTSGAPGQKSNNKNKMQNKTNPFDDDDDETVIDGSREGRLGITLVSFPASLSTWTTAGATPPFHSPPGEVEDDATWYHDCDTFFTTLTPKCWRNLIESIHRCSGSISTSGAPGRKENIKIKMQNTMNPFDDDNDTVVDDSWE